MQYYTLLNTMIARDDGATKCEWYYGKGEWDESFKTTQELSDAMFDYGDWSVGDYKEITEEKAMEMIRNNKFTIPTYRGDTLEDYKKENNL